ncbi:MAG TPA: DUF4398 domain-containing protein [Usitatibacter sp.]|nr:DUF4398 domain-containing protein [Usitatibacter sp.]
MRRLVIGAAAIFASSCAFVPQANHRLDDMKRAHAAALAVVEVPLLAPSEWTRASQAVDAAVQAHGTLQDPAMVDHLAYVALQRIEIARETARRVAAEPALQR